MSKSRIFFFTLFVNVMCLRSCKIKDESDPCLRFNTEEMPFLESRHPSEQYSAKFQDVNKFCDLFAINDGIWYLSDYNITQACVLPEMCGARWPIWLNGTVPSHAEGAVNRSACLRTYDSCCEKSYALMIKNCFYYYVYCFWELPHSCPQRFCFDVDLSRVTSTSTTTTTGIRTTQTAAKEQVSIKNTDKINSGQSQEDVITALATVAVVAVIAVVALASLVVVIKKKLTSVLPKTDKGGPFFKF